MSVFVERRCIAEDPRTNMSRKKRPFVGQSLENSSMNGRGTSQFLNEDSDLPRW